MASELKPCPFCRKPMMLREALWPSEGDTDAIIHADKTDCPMFGFGDGSADGSIVEKWNICSSDDEDDFPSDGSCIRCGSVPRNANGLCNTCLDEDAERLENTRLAPAATDTGLVTVAEVTQGWNINYVENPPSAPIGTKFVDRSQAEELLAAERAEKERAKDDLTRVLVHFVREHFPENTTFKPFDDLIGLITQFDNASTIAREYVSRIHVLEADNAALIHDLNRIKDHETELVNDNAEKDARIKELEAERSEWSEEFVKRGRAEASEGRALARIADLEAKLAAAEKALEGLREKGRKVLDVLKAWEDDSDLINSGEIVADFRAVLGGKPSC